MNQARRIESDAIIKKSVYRGSTTYTVHWTSHGAPTKKEFAEQKTAEAFVKQLNVEAERLLVEREMDVVDKPANAQADGWAEEMKVYLSLLESSPEELNILLKKLTSLKKFTLKGWVDHASGSMKVHDSLHAIASLQELTIDSYLTKLKVIESEPIDEILKTYKRYTYSKYETKRLLVEYLREYQEKEDDEDEVHFIKIKLGKLLRSFEFDIFSINDNHIQAWFEEQKGSDSAKERLLAIVNDFRSFANDNRIEMPTPFVQ
ncbi:hypothetical protein ISG33_09355 [Glaciecola sp. MH2013]|uniref:hypothetical protein n=1 Tax=Glaciecola sp. MH2013 TaxID=2785524 RepID=UPI00189D24D9|nr:hypothetical protein [Glaciecola sp. MH2013]MBF7073599.1 hypothetical protein [Glaciecola sp. MH2013]